MLGCFFIIPLYLFKLHLRTHVNRKYSKNRKERKKNDNERLINMINMIEMQNIISKYLDNIYPIIKDNQSMNEEFNKIILDGSLEAITGLPF